MKTAWMTIDTGLQALMAGNDNLADSDLKLQSKRLMHLAKFCKTLSERVNERLREGVKQGNINVLFDKYHTERKAVDINA